MSTEQFSKVVVGSKKNEAIERFHPWVFSGAIKKIYGPANDGDIVEVYSNKEKFLALGHYQNGSITVRLFSWEQQNPDKNFWLLRLKSALDYRKTLGLLDNKNTNVFRLVFAEGDNMPGFIADYYNGTCVLQFHSIGMYLMRQLITDCLKELLGDKLTCVYDKSAETLGKSNKSIQNEFLLGNTESTIVLENNNQFKVDWINGQKTGFFIDQRDNRELVGKYAKGKKVLNTFCYTGGFSIYALQQGAEFVHSVDSSAKAMEMVDENVKLNGFTDNHTSYTSDVFDFLKDADDKYDLIILDPPAFAKHRDVMHNAVQGYKRLNTEAFRKIKKGGILFTFSCSQVIQRRMFIDTVLSAAILAGRKVRVMHHLSQPADHPFSIYHPEGEYLKGLVLHVE